MKKIAIAVSLIIVASAHAAERYLFFAGLSGGSMTAVVNGIPQYQTKANESGSVSNNLNLCMQQGENEAYYAVDPSESKGPSEIITTVSRFSEEGTKTDLFRIITQFQQIEDDSVHYDYQIKLVDPIPADGEEIIKKGKIPKKARLTYVPGAEDPKITDSGTGKLEFVISFTVKDFAVKSLPWLESPLKVLPEDQALMQEVVKRYADALVAKDLKALRENLKTKSSHLATATSRPLELLEEGQAKFFSTYFDHPDFRVIRPDANTIRFVLLPGAKVVRVLSQPDLELKAGDQRLVSDLYLARVGGAWSIVY